MFNRSDPFSLPLLTDAKFEAFKAYGVYDEFLRHPLHGTFLVDNLGQIRWRDVGPEPFTDPDFVLAEARRLLKTNDPPAAE